MKLLWRMWLYTMKGQLELAESRWKTAEATANPPLIHRKSTTGALLWLVALAPELAAPARLTPASGTNTVTKLDLRSVSTAFEGKSATNPIPDSVVLLLLHSLFPSNSLLFSTLNSLRIVPRRTPSSSWLSSQVGCPAIPRAQVSVFGD